MGKNFFQIFDTFVKTSKTNFFSVICETYVTALTDFGHDSEMNTFVCVGGERDSEFFF